MTALTRWRAVSTVRVAIGRRTAARLVVAAVLGGLVVGESIKGIEDLARKRAATGPSGQSNPPATTA